VSGIETVRAFVERINAHDEDGLLALMRDDHAFIDAAGQTIRGRAMLERAWRGYFALIPDYAIEVEEALGNDDRVALFGTARGTVSLGGDLPASNAWRLPAAWLATVRDSRVAEWRVYSDTKPVLDIMTAAQRVPGAVT
jgi:ketosteroid isomerase-like protein